MQLVLRQLFPLGRFHATLWRANPFDDPYGEWPPSPWRLTRAVVARWYQWRRETVGTWPEDELENLIRALCSSNYRFYLPEQARRSLILRQYQPVEFGWNPAAKKAPATRSYGTSLIQDNAWCIPPDEDLFWFVEGDSWTPELAEILDRCLERIVYFGRAEALTRIFRTDEAPISANVMLNESRNSGSLAPVLIPCLGTSRTDVERVTLDPQAARNIPQGARVMYANRPQRLPVRERPVRQRTEPDCNLVQLALGWAVPPEPRAVVRLTARFRSAVLRNLILIKTTGGTARWSGAPLSVRNGIADMTGKDAEGAPLRGPRRHAEFFAWGNGSAPTRLLVWRQPRPFDEDERSAILDAASKEISWAAAGDDADAWKIKLVPLDAAVPPPPGFDNRSYASWASLTPYVPPRHHLRGGKPRPPESIENQIRRELGLRGVAGAENVRIEIRGPQWVSVHVPRREAADRTFIGDRRDIGSNWYSTSPSPDRFGLGTRRASG
jgi:CRISPR-associated protein Csb2